MFAMKRFTHRKTWVSALTVALMAVLITAPAAHAGGGGLNFEWCPAPLISGSPGCTTDTSAQGIVDIAKAAHVPGAIRANSGSYLEDVTMNGLNGVSFVGNANNNGPTTLNRLTVTNSKDITISDLTTTNGISVDKGGGSYIISAVTGLVSVTNSKFDHGAGNGGLSINTDGPVMLNKVSATGFNVFGLFVSSTSSISATDISSTKNGVSGGAFYAITVLLQATTSKGNHFDHNQTAGFYIGTTSTIAVSDTSASSNGGIGLNLDSGSGNVLVISNKSKLNRFDKNSGDGLHITTTGSVSLQDVSASGNTGDGVNVPTGPSSILLLASLSKTLHFDKNTGHGFEASTSGILTMADASASKNGGDGVRLGSGTGIVLLAVKSKIGHFDSNGGYGILATTSGLVNMADVSASKNAVDGAFVGSGGSVNLITQNTKTNLFDKNQARGLNINASGTVTLSDLSAGGNKLDGAYVSTGGQAHVLTNNAKINKFDKNLGSGLYLSATNGVLISHTEALSNKLYGLDAYTTNSQATVTCSTMKSNLIHDIHASLGTGNLSLLSVVLSHAGLGDVVYAGSGIISTGTATCS